MVKTMKVLIIKIKGVMPSGQIEKLTEVFSKNLKKGILVFDDTMDYEIVDLEIVDLERGKIND